MYVCKIRVIKFLWMYCTTSLSAVIFVLRVTLVSSDQQFNSIDGQYKAVCKGCSSKYVRPFLSVAMTGHFSFIFQ